MMKNRLFSLMVTTGLAVTFALVVLPVTRALAWPSTGGGGSSCGGAACPTYRDNGNEYCDSVNYDPSVHCTKPAGTTLLCACWASVKFGKTGCACVR